jgi:Protein of unknown function (DUF3108)
MRKPSLFLLLIFCCGALAQSPPQSMSAASQIHPPAADYKFPNGLSLEYKGEWRIFDAGVTTVRMDGAGGQQRVVAAADSTGFVAKLFHVHDTFESFFDPKTFCSLHLTKHIEEGSRVREITIRFDNTKKKSVLDQKVPSTGETKHVENDTPGCVTDVLSGIFYMGSLKLEPGMNYVFPMNDGGKTVEVRLQVEARESIKTDAGTFNTVRVHPEGATGKANILIWYSDDAAHIPVRLRSKAFWGTLTMTLKKIQRAPLPQPAKPPTASGSAR